MEKIGGGGSILQGKKRIRRCCTHSYLCWLPPQRLKACYDFSEKDIKAESRSTFLRILPRKNRFPAGAGRRVRESASFSLRWAAQLFTAWQRGVPTVTVKVVFMYFRVYSTWHGGDLHCLHSSARCLPGGWACGRGCVNTCVPGTKNKTGGGGWIACILSKTSITMSVGPNFPQVHRFDNANFLGTQCRTITNYLNSACNSLKRWKNLPNGETEPLSLRTSVCQTTGTEDWVRMGGQRVLLLGTKPLSGKSPWETVTFPCSLLTRPYSITKCCYSPEIEEVLSHN